MRPAVMLQCSSCCGARLLPLGRWRYSQRCTKFRKAAAPPNKSQDPLLDALCPVPRDQQPMLELQELKETLFFDWAELPLPQFCLRLASVWGTFLLTLGLPISVVTFNPATQPLECLVSASTGSLFLVTILVLRLYLGFTHVGSRLTSHMVVYEETGWHDAQVWVKTPQMLVRDRLLSAHSVRPALQRLTLSLYSLAGALAMSVAFLAFSPPSDAQQQQPQQQHRSLPSDQAGAPVAGRGYWERVEEFEPWAIQGDEDAPAADEPGSSGSSTGHRLGSGKGITYN